MVPPVMPPRRKLLHLFSHHPKDHLSWQVAHHASNMAKPSVLPPLSKWRACPTLMPRPERAAEEVLKQLGHVAEGVYFGPAIEALAAEKRVDMPITRAVCAVLFRGTPPRRNCLRSTRGRKPKPSYSEERNTKTATVTV